MCGFAWDSCQGKRAVWKVVMGSFLAYLMVEKTEHIMTAHML